MEDIHPICNSMFIIRDPSFDLANWWYYQDHNKDNKVAEYRGHDVIHSVVQ